MYLRIREMLELLLISERPRALVAHYELKQGNGSGKLVFQPPISVQGPASGKPAMEFTDRVLKCIDCGAEFVFTAGEQIFFHDKQFKNDPKHCKLCKAKRASGGQRVRPETRTTCSACGAETTVPFKPTQGRPVLCRSCFQLQGKAQPAPQPAPEIKPAPIPAPELKPEPEPVSSPAADD